MLREDEILLVIVLGLASVWLAIVATWMEVMLEASSDAGRQEEGK